MCRQRRKVPNRPRTICLPTSRPTVLAAELMAFSRGSCFLRLEVDRLEAEGRRGGACRYARSRSRCSRSQAAC